MKSFGRHSTIMAILMILLFIVVDKVHAGGGMPPPGTAITPDMFITIGMKELIFLLMLGLFGGMLSGFIGSGGAFVLTPGMMAIGAPGAIAVASNMCHKFPKAMIGAWRRLQVGHLDFRLAGLMAASAIFGVQAGIYIQSIIAKKLGPAGTNLYVTVAFLVVLPIVSYFCIRDVARSIKYKVDDTEPLLARKLEKKFKVPPMIRFKVAGVTQSLWLTIPAGFATGFLAATIAVGGFVGVPSIIYLIGAPSVVASGTELGIAFVMGSTGTFSWAWFLGAVDFRMTVLILAGSLIGVQIGAVGTTYIKQYMIKLAMAVVMLQVTLSRLLALPKILNNLGWVSLNEAWMPVLDQFVFWIMMSAMVSVTPIVLFPMIRVRRKLARRGMLEDSIIMPKRESKLYIKLVLFGVITIASYLLFFANAAAWTAFATQKTLIAATAIVAIAIYFSTVHGNFTHVLLDLLNIGPLKAGVLEELDKPQSDEPVAVVSNEVSVIS
jgi:uncharacterized membrane protein YfcA